LTYYFQSLAVQGVTHAVFTRLGGTSRPPFDTLNVGHTVGDDPTTVAENHLRIYAHLDVDPQQVASPQQVHGNRIAAVTADIQESGLSGTDGLVTRTPGVALLLRFADCQPILLYDPENHALGLVHAGWRGVAQAIARRAVEAMQAAFGTRPEALIAGLGPAIGPCCYTVGQNVASAMGYALPDWKQAMSQQADGWHLDISGANAQQLTASGVRQIEQAQLCTACHSNLFFSHRASHGRTGRFAVVAYLQPGGMAQAPPETDTTALRVESLDSPEPYSLHPPGFPSFQESEGGSR
jgi:YfiH family protein